MSNSSATDFGKRRVRLVDLVLDFCDLTFGVGTCDATRSDGNECFNTFHTCPLAQRDVYVTTTGKTYRFCEPHASLPPGFPAFPVVTGISLAAGEVSSSRGLGGRDQITVDLVDFIHDDEGVDPYRHKRIDPNGATFFERLLARNPHFVNRALYIRTGYVDHDGTLYVAGMTSQRYRIEDIQLDGGKVRIIARDLLAIMQKTQTPIATSGELTAALAVGGTSCSVGAGQGAQYDTYGVPPYYLRIGDEIILAGGRSTDSFTGLVRGQWGTTAVEHAADARVQLCRSWEDAYVDTIWGELLTEDLALDGSLVDTATAAAERGLWLPHQTDLILSKPTDTEQVIRDLSVHWAFGTWWDAEDQLVKFLPYHPREPGDTATAITDDDIIAGSFKSRPMVEYRATRCSFLYGVEDWSRDFNSQAPDKPAYTRVHVVIDADSENALAYGDMRDKGPIYAYSVRAGASGLAGAMAFRLVNRFKNPPRILTMKLEASIGEGLSVGDDIDLSTEHLRDTKGRPVSDLQCVVVKKVPPRALDGDYEFIMHESGTEGRWGFWAPAGTADYPDDDEYGHWADTDELMPNDDLPYLHI